MIRAAVAALVAALVLCAAAPASAQGDVVRLRLTAAFNQPTYLSTDADVRVTVTVENVGTVTATDVDVLADSAMNVDHLALGDLAPGVGAVRIEPGELVTVDLPVFAPLSGPLHATFEAVAVGQRQDTTSGEHVAVVDAAVTVVRGNLTGTVFGDVDGDGVADPGEGLVGGEVALDGGMTGVFVNTRVGANGVFAFAGLPAAEYYVTYAPPAGWRVVGPPTVRVGPGENTVQLRAVRAARPALTATVSLDRTTYAVGDTAREHVVLTNTGSTPLDRVMAACGATEGDNGLQGLTWGDLHTSSGVGVTLAPGERREFDFTEVVPESGGAYGFIELTCAFTVDWQDGPTARATARVPGRFGDRTGILAQVGERVDRPVPGVSILLLDTDTGRVIARAVSAGDGRFRFARVPAGRYEVRFAGPWRHAADSAGYLQVLGGSTLDQDIYVVPGPSIVESKAPAPTAPTALPAASRPRAAARPANLADTGASVVELTVLGALLLLAGGALLAVRQRDVS